MRTWCGHISPGINVRTISFFGFQLRAILYYPSVLDEGDKDSDEEEKKDEEEDEIEERILSTSNQKT